jgi:hypothetical protein
MTTDREADLICDVAERYGFTTLEVVRMVRLVVFGPLADRKFEQCGIYEPGEDERLDIARIERRLAERPPVEELVEIFWHCHEIFACRCEREPDLAKRAAMFTALREAEKAMDALRERARQYIERKNREKIEKAN